ncbi:OB-fold domain-containing protein [Halobacillus shinanisalinarum]|uniref:OB-fold domain-containing protein n=1 Tax=Halobacillus shinanisalinarum TaxID=2932258 RepID=A0ABY4GW24_9BACI|nr:OB-fold domain-containing protein [Halobacillus shinanisalinarum]UOQ91925.1 OB-fold domain-containing protein [Halobacillus shinanisalinarum]
MGLTAKYCINCDHTLSTDKYYCPVCFSDRLEEKRLSGRGEIYSFTNIYAVPKPLADQAPYYIVLVDLEEGLRVTARYNGDHVEIGKKVELESIDRRAYYFRPIGARERD